MLVLLSHKVSTSFVSLIRPIPLDEVHVPKTLLADHFVAHISSFNAFWVLQITAAKGHWTK